MDSGRRPIKATSSVLRSSLAYSEDRMRSYIYYLLQVDSEYTISHHALYLEIDLMKHNYPTAWILHLKNLFLEIHGKLIQTGSILDYCLNITSIEDDSIVNRVRSYNIYRRIKEVYRWVEHHRPNMSYNSIRHNVCIAFLEEDSQQKIIGHLYEKNKECLYKYCFLMALIDSKQIYNNVLQYLQGVLYEKSVGEILEIFHTNLGLFNLSPDGYLTHGFYRFIDRAINQEGAEGLTAYLDKSLRENAIPNMYVELYNLLEHKDRFELIYKSEALIRIASGVALDKELEVYTGLRAATGGLTMTKSLFRDALSSKELPHFLNLEVLLISTSSYSPLLQVYLDLSQTLDYSPSTIPTPLKSSIDTFDSWFKENQHKKRYRWIYLLSRITVEYAGATIIVNFIQFMILYQLSLNRSAAYSELK